MSRNLALENLALSLIGHAPADTIVTTADVAAVPANMSADNTVPDVTDDDPIIPTAPSMEDIIGLIEEEEESGVNDQANLRVNLPPE